MRRFSMFRRNMSENHPMFNPPNEVQFEGVIFSDGKVAIRWLTDKRSVSVWDSLDEMLAVHGHPEYDSELIWHDEEQ